MLRSGNRHSECASAAPKRGPRRCPKVSNPQGVHAPLHVKAIDPRRANACNSTVPSPSGTDMFVSQDAAAAIRTPPSKMVKQDILPRLLKWIPRPIPSSLDECDGTPHRAAMIDKLARASSATRLPDLDPAFAIPAVASTEEIIRAYELRRQLKQRYSHRPNRPVCLWLCRC